MDKTNMKDMYSEQRGTTYGWFHLDIRVDAKNLPNLEDEGIQKAAYEAAAIIRNAVLAAIVRGSPEAQMDARVRRENILGLFDNPIYVEEIPNGYCSDYCCKHLPWFVVTTKIGRIKIGWRKSVLNIDWSDSSRASSANELFPNENVTKGERYIHAWSYLDARKYIQAIISGEPLV